MIQETIKEMKKTQEKLEEEHPSEYTTLLGKIITELIEDKQPDYTRYLRELQHLTNKIYEKTGYNDTILDLQVQINKLRNELDIPDPDMIINTDKNGTYVQ